MAFYVYTGSFRHNPSHYKGRENAEEDTEREPVIRYWGATIQLSPSKMFSFAEALFSFIDAQVYLQIIITTVL